MMRTTLTMMIGEFAGPFASRAAMLLRYLCEPYIDAAH